MSDRRKRNCFAWFVGGTATVSLLLLALAGSGRQTGGGQTMHQQGFEGRDPVWVAGPADAKYKELAHKIIDDPAARGGQRSEYFQLQVETGTFIHYTYDVGRAPVADDLSVSLFVKASRPGVEMLCRVVLPHERDPQHPDQAITAVLRGEAYQLTGRWQQLRLRLPVKALREQQQLIQATLKREVNVGDAYVDRVMLNAYAGPGAIEIWTDDLEAGPVLDAKPVGPPTAQPTARPTGKQRPHEVKLVGNKLYVGDKPFFMRAIRNTGAPLKTLRDAGINTVWLDETTPPDLIAHAVNLGFWIVPSLAPPEVPEGATAGQLASLNEGFGRKVSQYMYLDAVLGWDLGSNLQKEHYLKVSRTAQAFRTADPLRPLSADVWDGFQSYARDLDQNIMMGVHRWPLMTTLDLGAYKDWLVQHRRLAVPEPYCWTWIQTHLPDWYSNLMYGKSGAQGYTEPIGPQPEQIRLMTYLAIGSGFRGIGYWSDRFLADSHKGYDRMLAVALLNQELEMLEPLLVNGEEPRWIDTTRPEVKAAVIRSEKAILVLPVWIGSGAQYVPGQSAAAQLEVLVPQVPPNMQPWEVSPGLVRAVRWKRQTGGILVTVPEFSLTGAVVFTADPGNPAGLVTRFKVQEQRMAQTASQWAFDQAKEELAKVEQVYAELEKSGHALTDGAELLKRAHGYLDSCEQMRRGGDFGEAYLEAQRATRPLRILMRAEWDKAVKDLTTPVASPYALSYYTLPRHWEFWQDIQQRRPTNNVLPDGDFEAANDQAPDGWLMEQVPSLDGVEGEALRVKEDAKVGKQSLVLRMKPKEGEPAPQVLERSYLAIHSPAVRLQPGTLVKISAWIKVPVPLNATTDGALFFDSVGGEPLALRLAGATNGWQQFVVYRKVPASGTINVTLALQGLGRVYFDDVRVEPLAAR
jgi:hypothetical protein